MSADRSPSSTPLEVSDRMLGFVDSLVNATHDQAPHHKYEAAYRTLLTAIAALETENKELRSIVQTCARFPVVGARDARDYLA